MIILSNIKILRILNLRKLEVYKLKTDYYGDTICFMVLVDYRRESTLDDYPELKSVYNEDEFGRKNYIKVMFIHHRELEAELKDELVSISGGFLEILEDCDWNIVFEKIDGKSFENMEITNTKLNDFINKLLSKHNCNFTLNDVGDDKFSYLSQD